jgi:hypothetical protein
MVPLLVLLSPATATTKPPRIVTNPGAPHVPNMLVVGRAISVDISMRAAGMGRILSLGDSESATAGDAGGRYTSNPLETAARQTRLDPGEEVVPALRMVWGEVGERGARMLSAQYAYETGSGRYCFNYNLGNHKAGANETHTYLRGVWEGISPESFDRMHADPTFGELVRVEDPQSAAQKGHVVPPGKSVVLFDPPHPASRFRANATMEEGVMRFADYHKRLAQKNNGYLAALTAGDCRAVAQILASMGYFTGDVDAYAQGLINHRDIIDEGLGPL